MRFSFWRTDAPQTAGEYESRARDENVVIRPMYNGNFLVANTDSAPSAAAASALYGNHVRAYGNDYGVIIVADTPSYGVPIVIHSVAIDAEGRCTPGEVQAKMLLNGIVEHKSTLRF